MTRIFGLLLCVLLVGTGCSNSGNNETAGSKDSTATTDTTKSDPETFSAPH